MSAIEHRFGPYGGQYVPETLVPALVELEAAWLAARDDPSYRAELDALLNDYVGRPSPLYLAQRLSDEVGHARFGWGLLHAARPELDIDSARLAETWRHGSVVRSWLLELCAEILKENETLAEIAPVVADSGEGRWTVAEAIELGVPTPAITAALMSRFSSQGRADYSRRLLAMMRARFGGHSVTEGK